MKKLKQFLLVLVGLAMVCWGSWLVAQQPQTTTAPNFAVNSGYTQGFGGGGYALTHAATGLVLNLGPGTADCEGTIVNYAGGTLTVTNSTTNYVYLNAASSCVPATSTSSTVFQAPNVPIVTVVASGGNITATQDARTFASAQLTGGGTTSTIASGTATISGTTIAAGMCASTVTVTATGASPSTPKFDTVNADFNGSPLAIMGYTPTDTVTIYKWVGTNNVNFAACNKGSTSATTADVTLNWRVVR